MEECLVFPSYTCLTRYPWPTSSLLCLSSSPGPYCMQGPPGRSPLLLLVMCIALSCRCNFRFFSHSCDQITNRKKLKGQCLFQLIVYRCNSSWKERCFGKSVKLLAHIWDDCGAKKGTEMGDWRQAMRPVPHGSIYLSFVSCRKVLQSPKTRPLVGNCVSKHMSLQNAFYSQIITQPPSLRPSHRHTCTYVGWGPRGSHQLFLCLISMFLM